MSSKLPWSCLFWIISEIVKSVILCLFHCKFDFESTKNKNVCGSLFMLNLTCKLKLSILRKKNIYLLNFQTKLNQSLLLINTFHSIKPNWNLWVFQYYYGLTYLLHNTDQHDFYCLKFCQLLLLIWWHWLRSFTFLSYHIRL